MGLRTRQRFEVRWESRFGAWPRDLALLLFSRAPKASRTDWDFRWRRKGAWLRPVGGFFSSVFLHVFAFLLAIQFAFMPVRAVPRQIVDEDTGPIYIDMQALKILRDIPRVKPSGKGGRPGSAVHSERAPAPAATVSHPRFTIVLNPMKPDNARQTILQKSVAPDLLIPTDQKLPDVILVKQPEIAKPQVDLTFHKPTAPPAAQNQPAAPAPTIAANAPQLPIRILATVSQPQLPVAYLNQSMAPSARSTLTANGSATAPNMASNTAQAPIGIAGTGQQPQLPSSFLNQNMAPSARSQNAAANSAAASSANGDSDMVILSVDPGTYSKLAALAQGNRYASIAIAPSPAGNGSPGGVAGGSASGGSSSATNSKATGAGGDASVAVGHGNSGGAGGGDARGNAILSISGGNGTAGGVDSHGILHGAVTAATVFPVISTTKFHRPPLVVATGPLGGGGLDAYGALSCGKVYTIFLPMPGKSWVLQYCAHGAAATSTQANDNSVHLEQGLVPPDANQQFDFRRTPIPDKDADKLIVLRASINKDGSVSDVHVFQGLQPDMDEQAVIAFSNWKFRPAVRASLPIAVDVLVGIPARVPEKTSNLGSTGLGTQN